MEGQVIGQARPHAGCALKTRVRDVTKHRAAGLRGEQKTERDSDGTVAEDCSDCITDDSDIVFIVENASRRFSSRLRAIAQAALAAGVTSRD